jgi:hypothetical protein
VNGKDRENTMEYDPNAALSIINSIWNYEELSTGMFNEIYVQEHPG